MKHIKLFEELDTDFQKVNWSERSESDLAWSKIYREWDEHNHPQKDQSLTWLIWLQGHYNAPTKKQ